MRATTVDDSTSTESRPLAGVKLQRRGLRTISELHADATARRYHRADVRRRQHTVADRLLGREVMGSSARSRVAFRRRRLATTMLAPEHELSLVRQGYVKIPGAAVRHLEVVRDIHARHAPAGPPETAFPANPMSWRGESSPGALWRIGVDEADTAQLARQRSELGWFWDELGELLTDHRPVTMSFLVKFPGADGVLPMHRDPTFADERIHRVVTVWVALDDVTVERNNGPLHVVPGSHCVGFEWRGTGIAPTFMPEIERVWACARPIDALAGDVVVMDCRLLHGSPPNFASRSRAVVAAPYVPNAASLCHALGRGKDMVDLVAVDDDFYWRHSPRALREHPPVDLPVIDRLQHASRPTSARELARQHRRVEQRPAALGGIWRRRRG